MKKILLLAFTVFSISSLFSQSQRAVFIEEFTQASCPPCEASTPLLNQTLNANLDKIVQLRYHTSWPGVDPMNADNPVEVQNRVDYYGINGVPSLMLDGLEPVGPQFPELVTQSNIDAAYATDSPVAMEVTHTIADDLSSVTVELTITNEGTDAYNVPTNRLRIALVEEVIEWDSPPGSTSITVFEAVMKAFVTGTDGVVIPEIAAGESWSETWELPNLPARIYDMNTLGIVAFIQDDNNRRVVQSAHSKPIELGEYPNVGVINAASTSGNLCDRAFEGSALVTNTGEVAADEYTVDFFLNGAIVESVTVEEALEAGASALVNFTETNLPTGNSRFGYIVNVAQGDISTANNFTNVSTVGKVGSAVAEINRTFENQVTEPSGTVPATGLITVVPFSFLNFTPVTATLLGAPNALGAYGESETAISVNFYGWNPASVNANGSMTFIDQYTVPETGADLVFDYAYTSWEGSLDRLIVEVSDDCGATFTELFNEAGSQLATAPELNSLNARFVPNTTQWETIESDLSEFAGSTLIIRFRVVSAWGDMLYLDNIELRTSTALNELNENESLNVFPNPASTYANVQLSTAEAASVRLSVIDMLGRVVKTENLGTVSGNLNHTLDVASLENGSYLIMVNVDGRDVVKRLTVAH